MRKMTELDIEHPTICLSRNSKDNSLYNNDFICANSKLNIMKMRQSSAKKGLIS